MKITVVIAAHPARIGNGLLQRALLSVEAQIRPPDDVVVEFDYDRRGSAATRNAAFRRAKTDWVAFLDSDDMLYPQHLQQLEICANLTEADLVYPWYSHPGRDDPFPDRFGKPFDEGLLRERNYIPITVLVRAAAVQHGGWFRPDLSIAPPAQCDEWGLWLRILDRHVVDRHGQTIRGGRFVHLPERTWEWNAHQGNTSGSPVLGDSKRYWRAREGGQL